MPNYAIEIQQRPVKNFWQSRGYSKPMAIVEHIMQGTLEETFALFNGNPASDGQTYKVSAHYGVARDGRVWQFVRDEDTAWANGILNDPDPRLEWLQTAQAQKVNPNVVTLAVEYEGMSGENLTEAQYEAALALHQQLIERWQIPADPNHIVGHDRLDRQERGQDPGPSFPWSRLLADLGEQPVAAGPAQSTEVAKVTEVSEPENVVEPDQAGEQEAVALVEPDPVVTAEAQPALWSEEQAQPTLDQVEQAATPFELDEVFSFDLDAPFAQLEPTPAASVSSVLAPIEEDAFDLPDWINEESDPIMAKALGTDTNKNPPPVTDEASAAEASPQFNLGDLLPNEKATQSFAIQPAVSSGEATQSFALQSPNPPAVAPTQSFALQPSNQPAEALHPLEWPTGPVNPAFFNGQNEKSSEAEPESKKEEQTGNGIIWRDLGGGVVTVELANVRQRPSFEPSTIARTVEHGMRLHFDGYSEGPELNNGTRWLHIVRRDGDGWIHSSLVQLDESLA